MAAGSSPLSPTLMEAGKGCRGWQRKISRSPILVQILVALVAGWDSVEAAHI